jgi:hypothetical protein
LRPALRRTPVIFLAVIALYVGSAAAVLRFGLDRLLFPHTGLFSGPPPQSVERIPLASGSEGLIRRYGRADYGCVVFFPGQHGYVPEYDPRAFTITGIEVWLLSYPGQDGAAGTATTASIEDFGKATVRMALKHCPRNKVVLLGVSLGATLATRSISADGVSGMVLVSAGASLSSVIRARLASKWYLAPVTALPLASILQHDYNLTESLLPRTSAAIFQGSADLQTPIAVLRDSLRSETQAEIVQVEGGTHSTTFALSREAQLSTISRMLAQPEPNPSLERP